MGKNYLPQSLLGVSAEGMQQGDGRALHPDVLALVASTKQLLHDATDSTLVGVVGNGQKSMLLTFFFFVTDCDQK
jgi:hypothetical protein